MDPDQPSRDREWMGDALEAAAQAQGFTRPNPLVGCVIVRNGQQVGIGHHQRAGTPHAEVHALRDAGEAAQGATAYVTLEPCSHDTPSKRTPPCAPQLIQAGLARVVIAMLDPNPLVSGDGVRQLREAGIRVDVGVLEDEARALNPGYLSLIERKRPWLLAKWAMTLDGKIATRSGASQWISSKSSRTRVHEERACSAAVMTGIGTVLADDPMLNARPARLAQPLRVVVDPDLETPLDAKLVTTAQELPTLIFHGPQVPRDQCKRLADHGVELCEVAPGKGRHLSWPIMLAKLGERACGDVLLEAGGRLLASAFAAGVVDEAMVFVAPKVFGGRDALTPVEGEGVELVADAPELERVRVERIGDDCLIRGRIKP